MDENLVKEKSEKSQFLERLSICLNISSVVLFGIGVFMFITQNNEIQSTSLSHGWNILLTNGPRICIGLTTIAGLILLRIANKEKDVYMAIIGILLPLMVILIK